MGTVETFDHTADVGLTVSGADLSDLFQTAAEGVFDYIVANRDEVRVEDIETDYARSRYIVGFAACLAERADLSIRDLASALHEVRCSGC